MLVVVVVVVVVVIELLAQRAPKYKAMVRLAGHGAPAA